MKAKLLTALLAMMFSSAAFTQQLRTIGNVDCGQWVARKGSEMTEMRVSAWLVGLMTGLNFGDPFNKNLLKKVSADQIFLWMDKYCKANPLKTVVDGGQDLMHELEKK